MILGLSVGILVIVVAVPVLTIFFNAFWVKGQFNLVDTLKILKQPDTYRALFNSLFIAGGVTLMSTIIGTFFAWLVTRTDLPFKPLMKVLFLIPFMLPSFIGALAWKMLLSPRSGYINRFLMDFLGFDGPIFNIYSFAGIMAVETMYLFPFVFISFGRGGTVTTKRRKIQRTPPPLPRRHYERKAAYARKITGFIFLDKVHHNV